MKSLPRSFASVVLILCTLSAFGDDRVVVVADAKDDYTRRKFGDGKPAKESYVYMQGRFYKGHTVDKSLDRMTFRELVSYLTPRLAEHQFVPAKTVEEADLIFLVHWGATNPRVGTLEMTGKTTWDASKARETIDEGPVTSTLDMDLSEGLSDRPHRFENLELVGEALGNENSDRDIAQLLGYTKALRKLSLNSTTTTEEQTLRFDLRNERYFLIVRAYDLRHSLRAGKPKLVWTVHMNISGPGNNFRTALGRMSHAGPQFFGTTTDKVHTVRSRMRDVEVELGDLIILGEAK